jgi:hypothetical protein
MVADQTSGVGGELFSLFVPSRGRFTTTNMTDILRYGPNIVAI